MSTIMRAAFCFALCSFSAHALTPSGPSLASTETPAGVADLHHNNNKTNKSVSEAGSGDVGASTGALPAARRFPGNTHSLDTHPLAG